MQRKLLAVGAAWALLAVSAGPAVASGEDGGLVGAAQSAANVVTQDASAAAETSQLVPVNANVPVAVASPGAGGDVQQANDASSAAAAGNVAVVDQSAAQDAAGGGGQVASNGVEQDAAAAAETVQVVPVNVNAPVAEPSTDGKDGCGCQPPPKHDEPAVDRSAGDVEQSNDASSSAAAGNVAIVEQRVEQAAAGGHERPPVKHDDDKQQDGRDAGKDRGGDAGQSAHNEVDQDADANAKTVQLVPVNVNAPIAIASPGAGGDVDQSNDASSEAAAGNVAIVHQDVDQTQTGSKGGDKPHGCGCNDEGDKGPNGDKPHGPNGGQSARNEVDQNADANATTWQIVPVNANLPSAEPGHEQPNCGCESTGRGHKPHGGNERGGDVNQSNNASSRAGAGNVAVVHQDVDQTQTGGPKPHKPHKDNGGCGCGGKDDGKPHGEKPRGDKPDGDKGGQKATNTVDQDADAHAKTVQLVPANLNAPVAKPKPQPCGCEPRRGKGKGKGKGYGNRGGDVDQSNSASSGAWAGNVAFVRQDIDQTAKGGGDQKARDEVDQVANARAKTVQFLPINANLPSSGGAAPTAAPLVARGGGCGCQGPGGPPWRAPGGGDVDQSNTASSWAGALNVAFVDQAIQQAAGSRR